MHNNKITKKAIGKIILIGEHSVVYHKPAIAIPFLSANIKATISEVTGEIIFDTYLYKGPITSAPEHFMGLKTVIIEVLKSFDRKFAGLNIKIESSIPAERGLGSSAAVVAATVRALYKYFNKNLDNDILTNLVNMSETIVHGNPSGIDSAIVVYEKALYYIKGQPIAEFDASLDGYMVVADTGQKGNTKFAVSKVKSFIEENPSQGNKIINSLEDLTVKSKKAITDNNAVGLGLIMTKAQKLLAQIGVSNAKIENLVKVSLKHGALGAKLTGGGLGGCIIALCKNKEAAKTISKTLIMNGAKNTWIMDMDSRKDKNYES